jgi:hypothetical protein
MTLAPGKNVMKNEMTLRASFFFFFFFYNLHTETTAQKFSPCHKNILKQ